MKNILVIPIGPMDPDVLNSIVSAVRKACQCTAEPGESTTVPANAYNSRRRQYDSAGILKALEVLKPEKYDGLLGVIDRDLSAPEMNFVFGQADVLARTAAIGLPRLRQEFYGFEPDRELFLERAAKEALHEIGHLKSLEHCPGTRCVMHFSNSLADTDVKEAKFCSQCINKFKALK